MASQIVELYNALALTSITVNGVAVRVKRLDELPNALDTAGLPCRLLTPISPFLGNNLQSGIWTVATYSGVNEVRWNVADIAYFKPVAQDIGIRAVADDLVIYMREYQAMISAFTMSSAGGSTMWVQNLAMSAGVFEYPLLSGRFFYGVAATLTVVEKIS